ncbi:hypothetical protein DXF93_30200, partial [Escherichia coli]
FFKQNTPNHLSACLVGSEMCIRDSFNNLLAVIIGSLELVNPQSPDAPRISRALKAAERGAMLTQRLLCLLYTS